MQSMFSPKDFSFMSFVLWYFEDLYCFVLCPVLVGFVSHHPNDWSRTLSVLHQSDTGLAGRSDQQCVLSGMLKLCWLSHFVAVNSAFLLRSCYTQVISSFFAYMIDDPEWTVIPDVVRPLELHLVTSEWFLQEQELISPELNSIV